MMSVSNSFSAVRFGMAPRWDELTPQGKRRGFIFSAALLALAGGLAFTQANPTPPKRTDIVQVTAWEVPRFDAPVAYAIAELLNNRVGVDGWQTTETPGKQTVSGELRFEKPLLGRYSKIHYQRETIRQPGGEAKTTETLLFHLPGGLRFAVTPQGNDAPRYHRLGEVMAERAARQ